LAGRRLSAPSTKIHHRLDHEDEDDSFIVMISSAGAETDDDAMTLKV
jgi:hypothetical protein